MTVRHRGSSSSRKGYIEYGVSDRFFYETEVMPPQSLPAVNEKLGKSFTGTAGGLTRHASLRRLRCLWNSRTEILLARCRAHVRRKFFESREESPRFVDLILRHIGRLYAVDRRCRQSGMSPKSRLVHRQAASRMILDRLFERV